MGALGGGCEAEGMTRSNEMSTTASLTASAVASTTTDDAAITAAADDDAATTATTDADEGWVLSKFASCPIKARSVEVRS